SGPPAPGGYDAPTGGAPGPNGAPGTGGMGPGMGGYDRGYERQGRRRRRRPRGGGRPQGGSPQQQQQQGYPQQVNQQGGGRGGRRGRRDGGGGGRSGRPQRLGLECLKELQQAGAALDPTERLVMELLPGQGDPPYGDRITGRAIDLIAP